MRVLNPNAQGGFPSSDRQRFLSLPMKPARLTGEEAAWFLGFQPHEISILMAAGLINSLGNASSKTRKYFALAHVEERRSDLAWLDQASDAISQHWRTKNQQR